MVITQRIENENQRFVDGRESLNTSLTDSRELFPFFFPPWRQRAGHGQTVNWGRDLDSLNLLTCAARWMVCDSFSLSSLHKTQAHYEGSIFKYSLGFVCFLIRRGIRFHFIDLSKLLVSNIESELVF